MPSCCVRCVALGAAPPMRGTLCQSPSAQPQAELLSERNQLFGEFEMKPKTKGVAVAAVITGLVLWAKGGGETTENAQGQTVTKPQVSTLAGRNVAVSNGSDGAIACLYKTAGASLAGVDTSGRAAKSARGGCIQTSGKAFKSVMLTVGRKPFKVPVATVGIYPHADIAQVRSAAKASQNHGLPSTTMSSVPRSSVAL